MQRIFLLRRSSPLSVKLEFMCNITSQIKNRPVDTTWWASLRLPITVTQCFSFFTDVMKPTYTDPLIPPHHLTRCDPGVARVVHSLVEALQRNTYNVKVGEGGRAERGIGVRTGRGVLGAVAPQCFMVNQAAPPILCTQFLSCAKDHASVL